MASALSRPATTYHLLRSLFTPEEVCSLVRPEIWQAAGADEALALPVEAAWQPTPGNAWARTSVAEQCMYMRNQLLRDTDWASMSHSVEVRVPLVDRRLTTSLGPLLAATGAVEGKAPLALSPHPALPQEMLTRSKTGFSLPMQTWVREDCRSGYVPDLPTWLTGSKQRQFVCRLTEDVARGRLHWSRGFGSQGARTLPPQRLMRCLAGEFTTSCYRNPREKGPLLEQVTARPWRALLLSCYFSVRI